ncbi:MAG: bifunctional tRNA (5-methylaminomethyl-2-thiouridine)(34)-methyltransferase MnmD/FAD-dependent 5-carboxymethylaminomethyl-2-thiouridine(34) oxidoreductase MnmC [Halopseudomonas sp.]
MIQPDAPSTEPLQSNQDRLAWDDQGQPLSVRFNDFYFSRVNGLDETNYVFLQHNQLPQRWQSLKPGQSFSIGETGFGTGLSFLTCWKHWRLHAPRGCRLHFISAERYPLTRQELEQALALWPELAELSNALINQYPPACGGFQRLNFDQGRVQLTLLFDDATTAFEQFDGQLDAWFLDGFSPAKNPKMWSQQLFNSLAERSHEQTTFSTFTAASNVRRGLESAGFIVSKTPGFSKKREMLYGHYAATAKAGSDKPWFDRPKPTPSLSEQPISVIGAGLAGACSAFALAEKGCQVQLFERGAHPGCGASGNPQGVLYAKLPATPTISSRIHLSGYLYSLRLLKQQLTPGQHWSPCGVLQLALNPNEMAKQQKLLQSGQYPEALVRQLNTDQASEKAGYPLTSGGLLFPDGGWVSPAELCRQLLSHPNIRCHFNQTIDTIHFDDSRQQWQLHDPQGGLIAKSATLVVANAHEAKLFPQLAELAVKPIRGQTTSVQADSDRLKTVLCGNGYIAPAKQQQYCFGASFDLNDLDTSVRHSDNLENVALIDEMSPELAQQLAPKLDSAIGRVGFRCATPDYLPIVGAVPDSKAFVRDYALLSQDAKAKISTPATHLPGLFVNLAHGSKGMITAPIAGVIVADMVCNEPLAMERKLLQALNPARFIIKKLIKRAI